MLSNEELRNRIEKLRKDAERAWAIGNFQMSVACSDRARQYEKRLKSMEEDRDVED
jgi:hypothetical protein